MPENKFRVVFESNNSSTLCWHRRPFFDHGVPRVWRCLPGVSCFEVLENGFPEELSTPKILDYTFGSTAEKVSFTGKVFVPNSVRVSQIFDTWLIASGRTSVPTPPVLQLRHLFACKSDFDVDGATETELSDLLRY